MKIWILEHTTIKYDYRAGFHSGTTQEHTIVAGVYSSREKVEEAITRLKEKPEYGNSALGFDYECYELDEDVPGYESYGAAL